MEKKGIHCFVSGRVQGVYYRDTACRQAKQLHITGWIRNLADGRVEVMACGTAENLETFCRWLRKGPVLARVTDVAAEPIITPENFTDFVTRPDEKDN